MKIKPIKATEGDTVKMSEVFDRMRYDALVDLFIDGRPSFAEAEAAALAIMNHDELLAVLADCLHFVETYSHRWDGATGKHPQTIVMKARDAINKAKGGAA